MLSHPPPLHRGQTTGGLTPASASPCTTKSITAVNRSVKLPSLGLSGTTTTAESPRMAEQFL